MNHRIDVAKWPEKGDAQLPRGADTVRFYFLSCMHGSMCIHMHRRKFGHKQLASWKKSKAFVGPILMHCNHETWVGLESLNIY